MKRMTKKKEIEGRVWLEGGDKDTWIMVADDDAKEKIEELDLRNGKILLEYKQQKGWLREAPKEKDWRDFQVGDVIDCRDSQNTWYESEIKEVKEGKIYVHFKGWAEKWNEWVSKDSDRLAPKGTHTHGPHKPGGGSGYTSSSYRFKRQNSVGQPVVCGAVGLRNLGNTCFMNSTLQCLSNTPGLSEYFRDDKYKKHINRKNPLGWGGKIAEAYGTLIKDIWSNKYRTIAPNKFKRVIGEFQPRFSGYQQHDSSELLSFLMDGLHEDLNRVKKKPVTEAVESNGRPDAEVAQEAWERHLKRNQSIIVDMCQGQLKSRVVCPDCHRESITFDPFMLLSVPLPQVKDKSVTVTYKGLNSLPVKYKLKVPSRGSIYQVSNLLKKKSDVDADTVIVAEVYRNRIYKVINENEKISSIKSKDDVWIYEIKEDFVNFQLVNKDKKGRFGVPILIPIEASLIQCLPIAKLRERIKDAIKVFVSDWNDNDVDEKMYEIMVFDKKGDKAIGKIQYQEGCIDLRTFSKSCVSLGLKWKDDARKRYAKSPAKKHSSYSDTENGTSRGGLHVNDCIREFVKEETLSKSEAWYCSVCKKHQCGQKKFDLWKTPQVLIIHLKRFTYDRYNRTKLDTKVDFPIEGLDVSDFIANTETTSNAVYDLYAVSNHFGGMGGGHYTAFAKNLIDNRWYCLDDSSVSELSNPNKSRTKSAYVLFYKRRE